MATITIEVADQAECWNCGEKNSAERLECASCGKLTFFINLGEFIERQAGRQFMDARYGGYVLGRNGPEDDILMFQFWNGNLLYLAGMMQGQEYILSPEATEKHRAMLEEINSEKGNPSELENGLVHKPGNVLDTNLCSPLEGISEFGGLLIAPGQFIINRYATKKHFELLQHLNSDVG